MELKEPKEGGTAFLGCICGWEKKCSYVEKQMPILALIALPFLMLSQNPEIARIFEDLNFEDPKDRKKLLRRYKKQLCREAKTDYKKYKKEKLTYKKLLKEYKKQKGANELRCTKESSELDALKDSMSDDVHKGSVCKIKYWQVHIKECTKHTNSNLIFGNRHVIKKHAFVYEYGENLVQLFAP